MSLRLVVLLAGCMWPLVHGWDNVFDGHLSKECPAGYHIDGVESHYNGKAKDRQFDWHCSSMDRSIFAGVEQSCRWWNDHNSYRKVVQFHCPDGGYVLTGLQSYHNNFWEDRKWSFQCCKPKRPKNCTTSPRNLTDDVNEYRQSMEWFTPHYIVGVLSHFQKNDRIWEFEVADVKCDVKCNCPSELTNDWTVMDISYGLNEAKLGQAAPRVIATQALSNPSHTANSKLTFTISESITNRFSYSVGAGVSLTVTSSFMAGIPSLVEVGLSLSLEVSSHFEVTKEHETTKMFEVQYEVEAPPQTNIRTEGVVKEVKMSVPYKLTVKHKTFDCTCPSSGIWHGVDQYDLSLRIMDVETNQQMDLAKFQHEMTYMYEGFVFPNPKVPKNATWRLSGTKCFQACDDDPNCAAVVMKMDQGNDNVGDCYKVTSRDLRDCDSLGGREDVEDFVVWVTPDTNHTCSMRSSVRKRTVQKPSTSGTNDPHILTALLVIQFVSLKMF